ncbi:hypothetical protein PMAYCL1PPCAC_28481, partial [Pristionchus mayeri]
AMIYDDKTIDEVLEMEKVEYQEQQNPLRADELKDPHRAIKIELLGIIATYQEPVCSNRIFRDYEEINGYQLDPTRYGFKNFTSMMRTFSDKFNCHVDFTKTMYSAKTTERSAHLQDLIRNQITIEEKRRRDMRRARSFSRPRRRNNYGAGIFYAQNFMPLMSDDRTEEERIADNLISFGRSLAEAESRGRGPNWGGMRSRNGEESSDDDEPWPGHRSKSVPPSRGKDTGDVIDDPNASGSSFEDCTNPFRVQNNERIRDIVIRYGEMDDAGRKGLALADVVAKFKEEHRQPLGGVPNIREDRLLEKMKKVDTTEWMVEKMADDVAYVIIEAATLKRVKDVDSGVSTMSPKEESTEAPKSPSVSPVGKRMLQFHLNRANFSNNRMDTRERVLQERAKSASDLSRFVADSDGDPVAMDSMDSMEEDEPEEVQGGPIPQYDRAAIMALNDQVVLEGQVVAKVTGLRLLRAQTSPASGSSSSHSSLSGSRRGVRTGGLASRPTPPVNSSSMWSSQTPSAARPSSGFGSFGTFKNAAPPANQSGDSDDDDASAIIQPSQSNLAFKLPTFGKDNEDSGYSELLEDPDKQRPPGSELRRQMRAHLGIPSDGEASPPLPPPGLPPMAAPPGMIIAPPPHILYPLVPHPFPPGVWIPNHTMLMPQPPPPSPGFLLPPGLPVSLPPPPPGMLFPPGLTPLAMVPTPPPGLWIAPLLHPPGLPLPHKDQPVEFRGEVYYERPKVWPPPVKIEERRADKRETRPLLIEVPRDAAAAASGSPSSTSAGPAPSLPSFGTSSQSIPSSVPAPRPLPTFGGAKLSPPSSTTSMAKTSVSSESAQKGSELLGATIQLIGKLQSGATVYMREIERTPVEDVVASNPDFFDIDEKDERIHLLHKDVNPKLLSVDGKTLGELAGEEKKQEEPAKASRAGAFSRPNPPTFGGVRPMPTFGGNRPTNNEEKPTAIASQLPTFGGNRLGKVVEEVIERPASSMPISAETSEPPKPLREMPTFGTTKPRKLIEVIEDPEPVPAAVERKPSINEQPTPLAGMPSFGTRSQEVQRPDSARSIRSEDEPRKLPSFGGVKVGEQPRPVQRADSISSMSNSSDDEGTQESKYTTAASGFSSRNGESMQSLSTASVHSSQETIEAEENEVVTRAAEESNGPDSFPVHKDISMLCKKEHLAFDSVHKGQIHMAALLTSFDPNRLVLTLHEDNMMDQLQLIMRDLRTAYVDKTPLSVVKPGQFAVAINGEIILRVVVLRHSVEDKNNFVVACLDFNAILTVEKVNLFEMFDRFGVHAVRASTFVARINGMEHLTASGHAGVKMAVKNGEDPNDDSVKAFQPFVFHGVDENGELVVDVAIVMGTEVVWMGEAFSRFVASPTRNTGIANPNIKDAIEYAVRRDLPGYEKTGTVEIVCDMVPPNEMDLLTTRSDSLDRGLERTSFAPVKREEKEEGELDSSHDESTTSERTTVDRHAAGDFVREVKEELPDDEFVVVAPLGSKPIFDVESMVSLIRKFNAKGENVEVDVIKSMARALILSVNKTLTTLGDRGALIANAEALEAIDMA